MSHKAGIEAALKAFRDCEAYPAGAYSIGEAIEAYLSASGMALVPREPTPVMLDSAYACGEASAAGLLEIYDMLIARAPDPFKST